MKIDKNRMGNFELKAYAIIILYNCYQDGKPLQSVNSIITKMKSKSIGHIRMKKIILECVADGTVLQEYAGSSPYYKLSDKGIRSHILIIEVFQLLGRPIQF